MDELVPVPSRMPPVSSEEDSEDAQRAALRSRMVSGLNPAQAAAVTSRAPALRILAGAGSGKTRVLTRRIALRVGEGEIDPRRVLAVTFTRKAASELRHRIARLGLRGGINAGTFHSVAYTQLRQRWEERNITPPELLDRKIGFVARVMNSKSSTLPLDVVTEIEWAKARMISAADYATQANLAGRRTPIDAGTVAEIYQRYEELKLKRLMVDFDDLLRLATRDIEANPEYAAARRWRFRHLFVDEFQDVNPLQFRLLQAWVGPAVDLCVVGDPNQAIYAWNGADSRFLDELDQTFPGVETIELTENYRSSPQILGMANTVLTLTPSRRFDLQANRPDGPVPRIVAHADETAEAAAIARQVRDGHGPGSRWADQAVLVRTNAQLTVLEEAFAAASIPFRSRGGGRFLDQPEISQVIKRLKAGGGSLGVHLADLEASLAESTDPATAVDTPEAAGGLTDERKANVAELVRLGHEYLDLEPEGSSQGFVGWLNSALRNDQGSGGGDAVDLATFHAAKGLEWPTVFVAGLEEGLMPIHFAKTADDVAEETRLMYVALTRAEQHLTLSWCQRRTFGTRGQTRKRSPLLDTLEMATELLADTVRPADLTTSLAALAAQRAQLQVSDTAGPHRTERHRRGSPDRPAPLSEDEATLFEMLKEWRLRLARANDVPAFVILTDATMTEIATSRPSNSRELLAVAGIGTVKAQRFGPDILRVIGEHSSQSGSTS